MSLHCYRSAECVTVCDCKCAVCAPSVSGESLLATFPSFEMFVVISEHDCDEKLATTPSNVIGMQIIRQGDYLVPASEGATAFKFYYIGPDEAEARRVYEALREDVERLR